MPPDKVGGVEGVVAILPEGADVSHVAEEPGAVLLRLDSDDEVGHYSGLGGLGGWGRKEIAVLLRLDSDDEVGHYSGLGGLGG